LLLIVVVFFGATSGSEEACAAIDAVDCQETSHHSMLQRSSMRTGAPSLKPAKKVFPPEAETNAEDEKEPEGQQEGENLMAQNSSDSSEVAAPPEMS